ncbi:MAG: sulfite exporter TauE/SafE family protein [Oscillospiraceae bacterium]|nr:sulfite exporter TauE/SafE family protein [Oscillospiraceae bacterium]
MKTASKAALTGMAAGFVNGLTGTGGGIAAVLLYAGWLGLERKKALATSMLTLLPLCGLSALMYGLRQGFAWSEAWPYLAGGLAGGVLAGRFYGRLSPLWLRRGFGALLAAGGLRMLFSSG